MHSRLLTWVAIRLPLTEEATMLQLIATIHVPSKPSRAAHRQVLAVGTEKKLRSESHRWSLVAREWAKMYELEEGYEIRLALKKLGK